MSELAKRIAAALVAAPLALVMIYLGGLPLAVFLSVVSVGCAWEFYRIAAAGGLEPLDPLGIPLAGAVPLTAYAASIDLYRPSLAVPAVVLLVVLAAVIWARGTQRHPLSAAAATALGVLYTGGLLSFGYALREHPYAIGDRAGTILVAFPLILTWASDIGAYFVGRSVGGRKLIPAVSPGKTVSGALGGLLTFSRTLWYPAYAPLGRRWGLTPFEDQQLAGLVMWIPASFAHLLAALFLFAGWLRASEERVHEREIAREAERVRHMEMDGGDDAWS